MIDDIKEIHDIFNRLRNILFGRDVIIRLNVEYETSFIEVDTRLREMIILNIAVDNDKHSRLPSRNDALNLISLLENKGIRTIESNKSTDTELSYIILINYLYDSAGAVYSGESELGVILEKLRELNELDDDAIKLLAVL